MFTPVKTKTELRKLNTPRQRPAANQPLHKSGAPIRPVSSKANIIPEIPAAGANEVEFPINANTKKK